MRPKNGGRSALKRPSRQRTPSEDGVKRDGQTWKEVAHHVGLYEEDDEWGRVLARGASTRRATRLGSAVTQPRHPGENNTDWAELLNRHHLPRGSIPPRETALSTTPLARNRQQARTADRSHQQQPPRQRQQQSRRTPEDEDKQQHQAGGKPWSGCYRRRKACCPSWRFST